MGVERDLVRMGNLLDFLNHKKIMNNLWKIKILSDADYEKLIAEVEHDGNFIFLLDREEGRNSICITFPGCNEKSDVRVPLEEFLCQLQVAVADLKR